MVELNFQHFSVSRDPSEIIFNMLIWG